MTHELSFNVLIVESLYMLKLQSVKITKVPAKCSRQMSVVTKTCFREPKSVTNAFGGQAMPGPAGKLQRSPYPITAIGEGWYF